MQQLQEVPEGGYEVDGRPILHYEPSVLCYGPVANLDGLPSGAELEQVQAWP